jgi:N-acetylneuraminate synthase
MFTIAEIGINHNGDLSVAKKLIDLASDYNFDSVKFQKRDINVVYSKNFLEEKRSSPWGPTQLDQKRGLEFNYEQYQEIDNYCKTKNIKWFASAWDINSLIFLDQFNLLYNKIASAMTADFKFVEEVAKRKKYTFISTGMTNEITLDKIVDIFKKNNCQFELMHCVSTYPCKPKDVNLKRIILLRKRYNCKVGYSGHEDGIIISLAALCLGISSLERHITLDRTMYGSDQAASLGVSGFRDLADGIKKIKEAFEKDGNINEITEEEKKISNKLRAHIKDYNSF